MRHLHLFFLALITCLFFISCASNENKSLDVNIVPYPNNVQKDKGTFTINTQTSLTANSKQAQTIVTRLNSKLAPYFNHNLKIKISDTCKPNTIHFVLNNALNIANEGYELNCSANSVTIKASSESGLFYGIQSLIQLFSVSDNKTVEIPAITINDAPRFQWRGMHLDVSRHFMPTSFIKDYIDYLAMNKMNVFHWHLVDGTGWRIEIKSHPELTNIGAWRVVKDPDKVWKDIEAWREGDNRSKYGGFYSQQEVKEIVKYAQERYVTILPEIELPGHSEIVFNCYPDLVCKDKKNKSLDNIGVYCASNPKSYQLLEDVLDEIIELFPSEYIHIGGDEVNKSNWKKCANCQKLMSKNKFDEKGLQSYFINHFDKYILSKGRKLMGWHEILEGKLSPSANIMYWGGIKEFENILKKGHPTVLATGTSYYFDHYQSSSIHEPSAWGGYTPLRQVYDLNPTQNIDPNFLPQILGLQGCIWTEHMKKPENVEYMLFPRLFALAENAWTQEKNKSWDRFHISADKKCQEYYKQGINCSFSAYRPIITTKVDTISKKLIVTIETEFETNIYYTIDGSIPSIKNGFLYKSPLALDSTTIVKAISVINSNTFSDIETKTALIHKARACKISLKNLPHAKYSAQGPKTLLDLNNGGNIWGNGKWLGFLDINLDATIEFDNSEVITNVTLNCISDKPSSIYFPNAIEISISNDGENYQLIKKWRNTKTKENKTNGNVEVAQLTVNFDAISCKYLRVVANCPKRKNIGTFIFIDEIIVQ